MDLSSETKSELKGNYSAPALQKGFGVIELLANNPTGLTVSDIAAGMQLSISEIFRIIVVMERSGWLSKHAETDKYRVTSKVLDLVFRATPVEELALVASPLMRDLSYRISQSCHVVVRHLDRGLVILRQESPGPTVFAVRPGTDLDLFSTCSGQVLLAFASSGKMGIPKHIQESISQRPDLTQIIKDVRHRGYQIMASPRTRGVTDISFPLLGFDGSATAALTIPFLELIDGTQLISCEEARSFLADTAKLISIALGWTEAC